MNVLLIFMQFLGGFYLVSVSEDYIVVTYFPDKIGEEGQVEKIIDTRNEKIYYPLKSEVSTVKEAFAKVALHEEYSNLKLLQSDAGEQATFLNSKSVVFKEKYSLSNYIMNTGYSEFEVKNTYAYMPILENYIKDKRLLKLLPWIGNTKLIDGKHFINTNSTMLPVCDMDESLDNFELTKIEICNDFPLYVEQALEKIRKEE